MSANVCGSASGVAGTEARPAASQLAPCPFCGAQARFVADNGYGDCQIFCATEDEEPGHCQAQPHIQMEVAEVATAIAAWNRRAADPVRGELVEALRKIVDALCSDAPTGPQKTISRDDTIYHLDGQKMYHAINGARAALTKAGA